MRFSASVFLALPLAAFAAEEGATGATGMFDQYKAQFQNFLGSFGAKPAAQSEKIIQMKKEQAAVEEVPVEGNALSTLTLDNWRETLFGSLPQDTTTPEEWWLFVTGRNKTCSGKLSSLFLSPFVSNDANAGAQATATRPRPPSTRRPSGLAP